jgi:hypothetical protein
MIMEDGIKAILEESVAVKHHCQIWQYGHAYKGRKKGHYGVLV